MKKALLILSVIALSGCMKKFGPDETIVTRGDALRLPPEYALTAPKEVKTIKTNPKTVEQTSQKLLLNTTINKQDDAKVNTWLLKNAGGNKRIKNIKGILKDDLAKEAKEK